jgi:hypothetical protein
MPTQGQDQNELTRQKVVELPALKEVRGRCEEVAGSRRGREGGVER